MGGQGMLANQDLPEWYGAQVEQGLANLAAQAAAAWHAGAAAADQSFEANAIQEVAPGEDVEETKPEGENLEDENPLEPVDAEAERGPYAYDMMHPGPLPVSIARNFAGGRYSPITIGEGGWGTDTALYRVFGANAEETGHWYSPLPQAGGLQSQIDLGLRPEWNNTADNVVCVYLSAGTRVYIGPIAAQTGYSPTVHGSGQSLGGFGLQIYLP
jgi:hypothetical protein